MAPGPSRSGWSPPCWTTSRHRQPQVAAIYHQRWEIENSYGELKTRLRGASFILRSRSPELVRQELFAFLTVYQALCALQDRSGPHSRDRPRPDLLHRDRPRRPRPCQRLQPQASPLARSQAIRDILSDLLPRRRDRQCDRVKKPPKNTFPAKKRGQADPAEVKYKITVTRKSSPTSGNALSHRHCFDLGG